MSDFDYDIAIIGGGSAGVACAKEAADLGARVLLADFTTPNARGNTWRGLGGTCSHVGCSPKKYMHSAAIIRAAATEDASKYGLHLDESAPLDWPVLIQAIQEKIAGSDWVYRVEMREKKIAYKQWLVRFGSGPHELVGKDKSGNETTFTAQHVVIACGGRPAVPEGIEGAAEHCITSDDFFSLPNAPGKTLCVGASYIALECAGVLSELGYPTSVMVRSQALRTFDADCAAWVVEYMKKKAHVSFIEKATPARIFERDGKKVVVYTATDGSFEGEREEEFDTVMMAVGRKPVTDTLNLEAAGVATLKNGKIEVNERDETGVEGVYAIGDIRSPGIELTPVAIQNGRLLARRLFSDSEETINLQNVPTTTFTPIEYGCVGMSEAEAEAEAGKDGIDVYLTSYKPFQWIVPERAMCFGKIIVRKSDDVILGVHYVGPDAGEVIQGMAIAVLQGVTKTQWDRTVTIHPTAAERLIGMNVTRESGQDFAAASCCG